MMIWLVFSAGMGCGGLVGLIAGKVMTEREMADYGEQRYNEGAQAGYDDGYSDCIEDGFGPEGGKGA